jgi:cytochrome c peroxidase
MRAVRARVAVCAVLIWMSAVVWAAQSPAPDLDVQLAGALADAGFTGAIESQLTERLGRPLDARLANLGRLLWFDPLHAVRQDNTCGGCHSPTNGFGDSQPIAIGVQSNGVVGPGRLGPRNQRRSPFVINTAFFPALMWNGRFNAPSGDPFDNSLGFLFPAPEGGTTFPPLDPLTRHLLQAQAHLPPTELIEVAGFTGTAGTIGPRFDQFDDGIGEPLPPPDGSGFRNEPIRQIGLDRLNGSFEYRRLFAEIFPEVAGGAPIDFTMFGRAIAEFEFTLVFADAPLDRFARGEPTAMSVPEKRGALLFFGRAGCVSCHAVAGPSNEMFSDFDHHVIGVPQIAPAFGVGLGNVVFDGRGEDEDFGLEQVTGDPGDRYRFRTAPLRNLARAPAFFHNGAFARLDDAIRHHLDAHNSARGYDPWKAGVPDDLRYRVGPIEPVLERLDPQLQIPIRLSPQEFADLVKFVRDGLLDARTSKANLCRLVPLVLPSGLPPLDFHGCRGY